MNQLPVYQNARIVLDGQAFQGIRFENCEFLYFGGDVPQLMGNEFIDCRWTLDGPANNTLDFLKLLVAIGGSDLVANALGMLARQPPTGGGTTLG